MILIVGQHEDTSTDKVCAWLNYYNAKFVRTNTDTNNLDIVDEVRFEGSSPVLLLKINGTVYDINEFDTIWCRRGHIVFSIPGEFSLNIRDNNIPERIKQHLSNEINTLNKFIEFLINEKQHINNPNHYNSNKLIALKTAQKAGLKVPDTFITQSSEDLRAFIKIHGHCITKNIQDTLAYHDNNYTFGHATRDVEEDGIKTEKFLYSLFQNKIEKKYELRIFYLPGEFYASAILLPYKSNDPDIRTTNKTNRYLPFCLPGEIKEKLHAFMLDMKLESGSIDIIVDKNNDYWFLEVNPVGQFDFLSGENNFYIEREIAKKLINGGKERFSEN